MNSELKSELKILGQYFLIALVAELAGAIGWLRAQYGDDSDLLFNVLNVMIDHERVRLFEWFVTFTLLGTARVLIRRYRNRLTGRSQPTTPNVDAREAGGKEVE